MQTSRPIDIIFLELNKTTSLHENVEDQLISRTTKIPRLQYLANNLLTQSPQNSRQIDIERLIGTVRTLEHELSNWSANTPVSWSYSTAKNLNLSSGSNYIPHQIHKYPNFYTARIWNLYRVSRLIVQSILLRTTSWLIAASMPMPKELDKSNIEETIRGLVDDICASVSFLLGPDISKSRNPTTTNLRAEGPRLSIRKHDLRSTHTGRFSLIWPLYIACSAPPVSENQRKWMREQLQLIAADGEPQARILCGVESRTLAGGVEEFRFDCV